MKKYFIVICLLLCPLTLSAHILKTYKEDMLNEAQKHKDKAICELYYAEDMCPYIPNLEKRQHLLALIGSSINAIAIPNPKDKLLSIGLMLIGSLAQDMYEEYCELRMHLAEAAHHFEMANFYNELSMHFASCSSVRGGCVSYDEGSRAYLEAIDYFTICDMLTICIEENWVRVAVSTKITKFRDFLLKELKNNQGILTKKISEEVYMFSENLGEIMEVCEDSDLMFEMYLYIYAAFESMEKAEEKWGIQ
jgi:hypothetical protein